jgi:2,3-bisphosphoglycerate-dependent phosphoglycerate mutase
MLPFMLRILLIFIFISSQIVSAENTQTAMSQKGILRVYVARHGQTDWNIQKRLQGFKDIPLNETGRQQAKDLAQKMEGIPLDAIYSSNLERSNETARIVAGGKITVTVLPDLNEQSLGKFEGAHLDGRAPDLASEYEKRSVDLEDTMDGGESINQHFARVKAALEKIRFKHPQGNILIVGHGGTNVLIMRALLSLTAEQADLIHQGNDELYLIELFPDRSPLLWKQFPLTNLDQL